MALGLNLDLLVPGKHQTDDEGVSDVFLEELNTIFEEWVANIEGLSDLLDPDVCPNGYLQYLADLLGTMLTATDAATEHQRRDELRQIIDWYKMKGTYQSVTVIEQMLDINFELLEMYTNDYTTFELVEWFTALEPGQNPAGLDSTYYNSPHFGYMIRLNVKYPGTATWPNDYLYIPSWFVDIAKYVERTRPIHTIPHYYLLLEPECDDDLTVTTVDGDIHSKIMGTWTTTRLYFDDGNQFDDGDNWDQHTEGFYNGITKWKIGTGSKTKSPGDSGWTDLESEVSTGTVDTITITASKIVWEFTIPAQNQLGISEIGLYSTGPDNIRIACLFPDINLAGNADVRVQVTVNRVV